MIAQHTAEGGVLGTVGKNTGVPRGRHRFVTASIRRAARFRIYPHVLKHFFQRQSEDEGEAEGPSSEGEYFSCSMAITVCRGAQPGQFCLAGIRPLEDAHRAQWCAAVRPAPLPDRSLIGRAGVEIPTQPQSRIGSDSPPLVHDLGNPCHRHTQIERQLVHADTQGLHEILAQNFPGMNRRKSFGFSHAPSLVIIHNLHVVGIAVAPLKTDAPLVIDADAVLPFSIALQRLQVIALSWLNQGCHLDTLAACI